jgi:hypothetical protein
MTYLIDQTGTPDTVFGNLFTIVSQDLGLGTANVPGDATVQSVIYKKDPANTTATAQRVLDIVNDPGTVVATGLPSGTTIVLHLDLPTGDVSIDVTGNGVTFHDRLANVVRIVYDTGQCNGQGIFTIGLDGHTHIATPNPVVLYHEMSHAFHDLKGTVAPTSAAEEQAAETDENVMRDQIGLPERLTTNHSGGCGAPGGGGGGGCLVVTAAYQPEAENPARWLHAVRGAMLPRYGLGGQLFTQAYAQYLQFSADIAASMRADEDLRAAVRSLVVDPLLRVYAAGAARWLRASVMRHAAGHLDRPVPAAMRHPALTPDREVATGMVAVLYAALASPGSLYQDEDLPDTVRRVMPAIATASSGRLTRWALVEPLALYWELEAQGGDIAGRLVAAVGQRSAGWLGQAPVLYSHPPAGPAQLADDLRAVLARMRLSEAEQAALSRRLIELHGHQVGYDLTAAIRQAGLPVEAQDPASEARVQSSGGGAG